MTAKGVSTNGTAVKGSGIVNWAAAAVISTPRPTAAARTGTRAPAVGANELASRDPEERLAIITVDSNETPTALTIAGSDSGGGAGIQADLKTFASHGVYGICAVTAVTAQNTVGVTMIETVTPAMVTAQIDAVVTDFRPRATKIGMLANVAIVEAVAEALERHRLPNVVLDTVMIAKSLARLLDDDAIAAIVQRLLPLAAVVTPNVPEAEALTGLRISNVADLHRAPCVSRLGEGAVLAKGGTLGRPAIDVLWSDGHVLELTAERIASRNTHGTGCTLSAAIAARLALGDNLEDATRRAKAYVTRAIAEAPGLGAGHGPLQHFPSTR